MLDLWTIHRKYCELKQEIRDAFLEKDNYSRIIAFTKLNVLERQMDSKECSMIPRDKEHYRKLFNDLRAS